MESNPESPKQRVRLSPASKVLIGLGPGVFAGIFLGEHIAFLKIFGDAFIQLLQRETLSRLDSGPERRGNRAPLVCDPERAACGRLSRG